MGESKSPIPWRDFSQTVSAALQLGIYQKNGRQVEETTPPKTNISPKKVLFH